MFKGYKQTDIMTAIIKLKEGHKVISIIHKEKYPSYIFRRKYEYNPKGEYSICRGHIMYADWYYEELKM